MTMLGMFACLAAPAAAQGGPDVVSFSAEFGKLPEGFQLARTGKGAPAGWSVVEDSSVPSGRVLAQTSSDQTDYRFPLAIYDRVNTRNVEVSVRFKPVAGQIDRAGGIAVRLADADNYYVVRANALEDNVNLYRVVQGSRREIHGVGAKVTSDQWHTLSIKAEGDRFTISFDGTTLFTASDRTFAGTGKIALWTKADSITRFDALTILPLR
jgi:Galactocerebrosidase, C-terminal lectin domain